MNKGNMNEEGLKKRFCNPPAERMAECGDPEVLGYFQGAGEGLDLMPEDLKKRFVEQVAAVEKEYIAGRKMVARRAVESMEFAFQAVLSAAKGSEKKEPTLSKTP